MGDHPAPGPTAAERGWELINAHVRDLRYKAMALRKATEHCHPKMVDSFVAEAATWDARADDVVAALLSSEQTEAALASAEQERGEKSVDDLHEAAWGLLANVSGGDWTQQTSEWQEAVARWRNRYHAALHAPQCETATLTEQLARAEEQLHEIWRVLGLQREPGVGAPYLLPADAGPVRCESIADAVQGSLAWWQRVAMTMSSYASHACPDASQCTCGLLELQRTIDAALRAAGGEHA